MAAVASWLPLLGALCLWLGVAAARDSAFSAFPGKKQFESGLRLPSSDWLQEHGAGGVEGEAGSEEGTRWALLIAGSAGYWNYRHQADVCHAYQLLRRDGLKDENIVVFMFDDIAHNEENPYPGTIINHPQGSDVYHGVPKDYTGDDVTVNNFLAALLGDKSAIKGGSGKVVASGPHDHVFVSYTDHGGPGILGMPGAPFLLADDIINTLKKKHKAGGYKELAFYLEACESGSIFQGLLPKNINVYAVTAANAVESSWGTYCPGMDPPPPPEYETCLGDLFSVAWMEDSDVHNLHRETLHQQYELVKTRTAGDGSYYEGSHVLQFGNKSIDNEEAAEFLGSDPANDDNAPVAESSSSWLGLSRLVKPLSWLVDGFRAEAGGEGERRPRQGAVAQREADLLYFEQKYLRATDPEKKGKAMEEYLRVKALRSELELQMSAFTQELVKFTSIPETTLMMRGGEDDERPLVEDWQCLRRSIRAYERVCGPLTQYGMQYTPVFAAICNLYPEADKETVAETTAYLARAACSQDLSFEGPFSV